MRQPKLLIRGTNITGDSSTARNRPETKMLLARARSSRGNQVLVSWLIIGTCTPSLIPSNTRVAISTISHWLTQAPRAVNSDHRHTINNDT